MKISLAGWSLNRRFRKTETNPNPPPFTDFPRFARTEFGIEAIELNSPFMQATSAYAKEYRKVAEGEGVKLLNIAVDEPGDLCDPDAEARAAALRAYGRWIPIAAELGCSAIRANSGGHQQPRNEVTLERCAESFAKLAEEGKRFSVKVLVENHWGISEDADTIVKLVKLVDSPWFGTLPDFGNWPPTADRYAGLEKIMPYAGAVHAKMYEFDERGEETKIDVKRCVAIARRAGYDGWLGIEYEGKADEHDGVLKAKALLERYI